MMLQEYTAATGNSGLRVEVRGERHVIASSPPYNSAMDALKRKGTMIPVNRGGGAPVYDQLKSRVASLLARPRPMKPQTERQLAQHLAEHTASTSSFLLCAAQVLEDYELDILFGPMFTPTLDERAELADLLFHWRPSAEQLKQLVADLCDEVADTPVALSDGTQAKLMLHEVMIERFVRLLRLDC